MPINSFENYPLTWAPVRGNLKYPYYASLANLLEYDIECGVLPENTMLPPQRELADFLDISLSTVTKAYSLCKLKGLVYGIVGKGTFVTSGHSNKTVIPETDCMIEMGLTLPLYGHNQTVAQIAGEVLKLPSAGSLFEYSDPFGTPKQIMAAQKWLSLFGVDAPKENIMIASGAQNALALVLMSLFKSGDKIATDLYTYPNFIGLANMLGIELIGVKGDESGILPDALDQVCKNAKIQGIYLMPACANPTNIVMSAGRRADIALQIKKTGIILIEDDTYAFVSSEQGVPMTTMQSERSIYINSVSKSLCAGLRVAFLSFPDILRKAIESAVYNVNLKTSSLNAEIAAEIIIRGTHRGFIAEKQQEAARRNEVYFKHFPETPKPPNASTYYQWLRLPSDHTGRLFELMCREKNVNVYGSERFRVGEADGKNYVRIATTSPKSLLDLEKGLGTIREIYDEISSSLKTSFII